MAQIPSLLLAIAVAVIVTRMSRSEDMGKQLFSQLLGDKRVLRVVAILLGLLGIVPGMPNVAFLLMAGVCAGGAWLIERRREAVATVTDNMVAPDLVDTEANRDLSWSDVGETDAIALDVGYRLIPLVDRQQDGELMRRIKGVRKRLSDELGFLVSPVRIRDDLDLPASGYRLSVMGSAIGTGEVQLDRELAINPGHIEQRINGVPTRDPAYGLEAVWIEPGQREEAQARGYTVVDVPTVIATHLSKVLHENAHEIFGHQEAQELLDRLAKQTPKLIEELVPKTLPLSVVVRVLQELLREQIPVNNMRAICQTLAEHGRSTQDPEALTSARPGGPGPDHRPAGQRRQRRAAGHHPGPPAGTDLARSSQGGRGDGRDRAHAGRTAPDPAGGDGPPSGNCRPAGGSAGGANAPALAGEVSALCSAHAAGAGLQRSSGQQARAADRGCRHLSFKGRGR